MKVTGGKPTSPKASRGKAGIRPDIHPSLYFYSRWEANTARLYTFQNILWEFSPTTFDIGNQTYTPDFYLPESDTYIEVKNFWGEYSRIRDTKFRLAHKKVKLTVILKDEYHRLEKEYAHHIPLWEYKNST
jgi:predicted nuclease of restriction endonuclease-like RecB superfamily